MKDIPPTPPPKSKPSIHLNIEDWMPYLAASDVSEAEKIALIETLWAIMLGFADYGWDIADSEESSGQSLDLTALLDAAVLYSEDQHKEEV